MLLDIVTPERRMRSVANTDVRLPTESDDVILPGISGEFEVLPGHAPYITELGTGILSFQANGKQVRLVVSGGYAEVDRERVTVLCDEAALAEEVEASVEERNLADLERRLHELTGVDTSDPAFVQLKVEAERAAAKLRLVK